MNIFDVLNQGKSRLHEPSISAMLGYLLEPTADHGLGDSFLRSFIEYLAEKSPDNSNLSNILKNENRINAIIELEVKYNHCNNGNDIDIQLSILDPEGEETHRIIIENKVNSSSSSDKQLKNYYEAIINDKDFDIQKPYLTIVFLTPECAATGLEMEFNYLSKLQDNHDKIWIKWTEKESSKSLLKLIKNLLEREILGEINPINEYMRHTLKAFIKFIQDKTSGNVSEKKMRTGQDIGNITDEVTIRLKNGSKYKIIRRDSSQIQLFNEETGEKEIARQIMANFIDENNIDIEHSKFHTRTIGRKLLSYLKN